jgi:hypothetical protein
MTCIGRAQRNRSLAVIFLLCLLGARRVGAARSGELAVAAPDARFLLATPDPDRDLTYRFTIYGGGGIGGGGYRAVIDGTVLGFDITNARARRVFAWQASGGFSYSRRGIDAHSVRARSRCLPAHRSPVDRPSQEPGRPSLIGLGLVAESTARRHFR